MSTKLAPLFKQGGEGVKPFCLFENHKKKCVSVLSILKQEIICVFVRF